MAYLDEVALKQLFQTKRQEFLDTLGASVYPYYHFHGCAVDQILGDRCFYDQAGTNHGLFGANLSNAAAWANAGFVTTVDPAGGATDSVIRLSGPLNFDYAAGEKLIVFWQGKITAGTTEEWMGNGIGNTQRGVRLRGVATNQVDFTVYGATTGNGFATNVAVADGALHTYALMLDGENQVVGQFMDNILQSTQNGVYTPFVAGTAFDTKNNIPWVIGAAQPKSAASTNGTVVQCRQLVILRYPPKIVVPTVEVLQQLFDELCAKPGRVLTRGDL